MAYGRLGVLIPSINTLTSVCTISPKCKHAKVNIFVNNPSAGELLVDIAIATSITPAANEYITQAYSVDASNGSLEITEQLCSPGEMIVVKSNKADTVFRVTGIETI